MEEDGHRRFPCVHNAYAHVCKSFQDVIERNKSVLVHLPMYRGPTVQRDIQIGNT